MSNHENLNTKKLKSFRTLIGQLGLVNGHSRPDIASEIPKLHSEVKHATVKDLMRAIKILQRMKLEPLELIFIGLGNLDNVEIIVYNDSSFGYLDNGGLPIGGFIFLTNSVGDISPIMCQSKRLCQVVKSILASKTLTRGSWSIILASNMI